jgi:hypothetical protein
MNPQTSDLGVIPLLVAPAAFTAGTLSKTASAELTRNRMSILRQR